MNIVLVTNQLIKLLIEMDVMQFIHFLGNKNSTSKIINLMKLTISAHANSDAFFQSAILAPISIDPKDGALLVFGAGPILDLLLYGAAEEALRITAAIRVSLGIRVVVTGASRVGGLAASLQHAHQHRMPLAQLSATRHR